MLDWLAQNATLLQVVVAIVTALVWLVYLQLFLMNYLRQRRPEILISRGPGVGMEARCFIANLGLEPIYISELLIWLGTADDGFSAAITDRQGMTEEQMRDPKQATNQGPLTSGDSFDAGSFGELMARALRAKGRDENTEVQSLELTVVAVHAASSEFVAAVRRFDVIERRGYREVVPDSLTTRQVRSFLGRWRLRRKLQRDLSWYRS